MIAISLWQPWASALFAPVHPGGPRYIKEYETRSWAMPKRLEGQTIAIHAAQRDTGAERRFWQETCIEPMDRDWYAESFAAIGVKDYNSLPRGCIIGTLRFGASIPTKEIPVIAALEWDWGNYESGRFAWPASEQQLLAAPVPCTGRQGFFKWEPPADPNPYMTEELFNLLKEIAS